MKRAAFACLVAAAILPACRERSEAPGQVAAAGTLDGVLRRRLLGEPTTLNAVLQSSVPEAQVLQNVQRNLFDFDERLVVRPGLASGMEVSAGGREYTVTLRPEAVWEDGRPVTASDAVFTIRKVADAAVPSPVFKTLFEDLELVEALDTRRFRARFRSPYAFRAMAFVLPVVPEHAFLGQEFLTADANRAPLSNGPYRVVAWKAGESVELERNPRYWGERGRFDRVVFRIVPDNTTAFRLLASGELDEDQIDATLKARAESDPEFAVCCRLVEFYTLDWSYVALNNRSPFFADARVRRALTMLTDRAEAARALYRGSARVISGPWAPGSPAYDQSIAPLPFDPAAAKALLAEAGWKDTDGDGALDRDGRKFSFEHLIPAGFETGRQVAEMLAAELARAGVTAAVRTMEWAAFIERVDAGEFEAASLAWSAVDPNPDPYPYWHSSQCPPNGLNAGCYRNADADRLMTEARAELDAGRRDALYHRLHRILRDDAPVIFLVNSTQKFAFRRDVQGVTTSPLGLSGIWPGPLGWFKAPAASSGGGRTAPPKPPGAAARPAA
jgi:peptide/nickel transport system substrate-binding protein